MFLLLSLHSCFFVSECPHENIAKVLKLPSFVTANLLFTQPIYERIIVGNQYCDIPLGTCYLIRGENVVMMGRVVSFLGFCFSLSSFSPPCFCFSLPLPLPLSPTTASVSLLTLLILLLVAFSSGRREGVSGEYATCHSRRDKEATEDREG